MTETELIIEDVKRLYTSREELLGKINEQGKDIKELFAYVEHNADYADQLRIDLGDMIEQQRKDIEKLSERITKFHDDACQHKQIMSYLLQVEDRIGKLEEEK